MAKYWILMGCPESHKSSSSKQTALILVVIIINEEWGYSVLLERSLDLIWLQNNILGCWKLCLHWINLCNFHIVSQGATPWHTWISVVMGGDHGYQVLGPGWHHARHWYLWNLMTVTVTVQLWNIWKLIFSLCLGCSAVKKYLITCRSCWE